MSEGETAAYAVQQLVSLAKSFERIAANLESEVTWSRYLAGARFALLDCANDARALADELSTNARRSAAS